jgi:hypothetical protein
MVDTYTRELNDLTRELDGIESAGDDTGRLTHAKTAKGQLKAKQNKRSHIPLDPDNLPFQASKNKVRPPKETQEELEQIIDQNDPVQVAALELSAGMLAATAPSLTPSTADLAETEDVQITDDIKALAAELNYQPVAIYNWVRNHIEYLPTYGSIQGSQLTLTNKRGNAFDTASLLIALLRASNIPARYAYGTVQIPIDKVMNWVGGVEAPMAALDLMGQGGIPVTGLAQGGVIKYAKLEHIWVEAWVDYHPSRGAKNKTGDSWVPMDASFKHYDKIPTIVPNGFTDGVKAVTESYLQSATSAPDQSWATGYDTDLLTAPLETLQTNMDNLLAAHPDKITLDEIIGGQIIQVQDLPMLANSLPYKILASSSRVSALPGSLRVSAKIELQTLDFYGDESSVLFSKTVSLPALGAASLNLSAIPASDQDKAVWDSYTDASAERFPAYLVKAKARLSLAGINMAETSGMLIGQELILKVVFSGAGNSKTAKFQISMGDELEIGINGAGQAPEQGITLMDRTDLGTAAGNLYAVSKVFWTQHDFQDRLLARLNGVVTARLPSAGIFAAPVSIVYNFGIPRWASYHSRQVDIKLSNIAAVALDGNNQTAASFIMQAGMMSSSTEGAVIEEVFAKPLGHGSNTMRLLQLANAQKLPIYHLTAENIAANRAVLQHATEVMMDIDNALNAGLEVIIPQASQTNGAWTGSGYIMLDPISGSADYRVSGGLSGNFDNEECQRSAQPIKMVLPDIALIWSVLFGWMVDDNMDIDGIAITYVLSQVAAVGTVVRASAYVKVAITATGAIVKKSFEGILVALFGMEVAEAASDSCSCEPKLRNGHLGGNEAHNACADSYSEDEFKGGDVKVAGKNFDAFDSTKNPPGTLFEVKTGTAYTRAKNAEAPKFAKGPFLNFLRSKATYEYYWDLVLARGCGFEFNYITKDAALAGALQEYFIENGRGVDAARVEVGCNE